MPARRARALRTQPAGASTQQWHAGPRLRLLDIRFQIDKPKHTTQNRSTMKRAQPPRHTMPHLRGSGCCCTAAAAPHSTSRPQPHLHARRQQHNPNLAGFVRCALAASSRQPQSNARTQPKWGAGLLCRPCSSCHPFPATGCSQLPLRCEPGAGCDAHA